MVPGEQARILLFHEDVWASEEVESRLARAGFEVRCARSFLGAAPHLARGRSDLVLLYLPATARLRNVLLTEVRRVAPSRPVVAMAESVTDDLRQELVRFGVAVLPTNTSWDEIVRAIRLALAKSPAAGRLA